MNGQEKTIRNLPRVGQNIGRMNTPGSSSDSLQHRNKNEDSITIYYRYLDSTRHYKLDSTINDFTTRFPVPSTNVYLGNLGNASRSILFSSTHCRIAVPVIAFVVEKIAKTVSVVIAWPPRTRSPAAPS